MQSSEIVPKPPAGIATNRDLRRAISMVRRNSECLPLSVFRSSRPLLRTVGGPAKHLNSQILIFR